MEIRRNWEECPRDVRDSRWAAMYVSLNPGGDIIISRATHEVMGSPDSYVLLYDRERDTIGLRPARLAVEKNAYKAIDRGPYGGKRINGYRMCRQFGIDLNVTVRFHHCQIDNSGVLVLDLRDTVSAKKGRRRR